MNSKRILVAMCVATSLCVASCSGGKAKKETGGTAAPAPITAQEPQKQAPAPATPQKGTLRTPAQLLAELPCKMQGKKGMFAVFPDNDVAGQICFKLSAARGDEATIPTFDIHTGGIYVIFHDVAGTDPGEISFMKWEDRGGSPCMEDGCGTKIATKRETYSAADEAGWTYVIASPEKPIDLAAFSGGFVGLSVSAGNQIPLFR